ncbi:nucleotidyltransferase family protein [Bowmanella denitrificans]|uniref:Nucleotidyltransferase family protein n=1 Tax=Bowmanella denitrificans TaxID=366582 RepID=A0ABN0X2T2_9ALTE
MEHVFVLKEDSTLLDAIEALDKGGIGFLAFVDDYGKLVGIITDGDIRRAILKNKSSIQDAINNDPVTMPSNSSRESIVAKLKQLHRRHMPLVSSDGKLNALFTLDDIEFISRPNPVVIMAGGLGARLGELTKDKPKPMLKVGDRPMLQHLIEHFRDQGFYKFILCVNYKKEVIMNYFSDGTQYGVSISYIEEKKRLGTAGALGLIPKHQIQERFFVVNADVLANVDFGSVLNDHIESGGLATMCVRNHEFKVPYGVVNANKTNIITSIEEKPSFSVNINAGVYILEPSLLYDIPENEFFDMPTLFEQVLIPKSAAQIYKLNDYWVDIGQVSDYVQANNDLDFFKK